MSIPSYAVDFRGHPACPCQVEWLPVLEAAAQRLGILRGPLPISQLIGGDPRSGGTHIGGGESDFYPLTGIKQVDGDGGLIWLCRQMGADPTWHRLFNWDGHNGVEHTHCGLRGCPHRAPAAVQQEWDVDHNLNGLADHGPDTGPRPLSGRTWQEGIAWAQAQGDEVTPEDLAKITAAFAAVIDASWAEKPKGSKLTRDQLLKQAEGAAAKAAKRAAGA